MLHAPLSNAGFTLSVSSSRPAVSRHQHRLIDSAWYVVYAKGAIVMARILRAKLIVQLLKRDMSRRPIVKTWSSGEIETGRFLLLSISTYHPPHPSLYSAMLMTYHGGIRLQPSGWRALRTPQSKGFGSRPSPGFGLSSSLQDVNDMTIRRNKAKNPHGDSQIHSRASAASQESAGTPLTKISDIGS